MRTTFLKTTVPDFLHGNVVHPVGSVVEVEERRARQLFDLGHAEPHDGPAFIPEPEPDADDEGDPGPKKKGKAR